MVVAAAVVCNHGCNGVEKSLLRLGRWWYIRDMVFTVLVRNIWR
jgi:hypothetical protein